MRQAQEMDRERVRRRREGFPCRLFSGRRVKNSATVIRADGELLKTMGIED